MIGEKTILLFFFTSLFLFTLYLAGNFQRFLDSNQIMLLEGVTLISVALFVFTLLYGFILLLWGAGRRKELTGKYIFFIVSLTVSVLLFSVSKIILVWVS